MKRISTDEAYLEDKTLVVDADGIPVDLTLLNGEKAEAAAERVERIAESTSWSGDRLTVNGKTSPSLSGPRGPEGIGNTTTVQTEAEAQALTGLPVGHKVYVVGTGNWYEVSSTMALQIVNRRAYTITANAGKSGQWLENHIYGTHYLEGLYLMVLEGTGTNPPRLNLRGGDYGQYGITIDATASPHIRHVNITPDTQIILVGSGEGDGKTRVTFIKLGEIK